MLLGLAVHWRVYPIVYSLPIILSLPSASSSTGHNAGTKKVLNFNNSYALGTKRPQAFSELPTVQSRTARLISRLAIARFCNKAHVGKAAPAWYLAPKGLYTRSGGSAEAVMPWLYNQQHPFQSSSCVKIARAQQTTCGCRVLSGRRWTWQHGTESSLLQLQ